MRDDQISRHLEKIDQIRHETGAQWEIGVHDDQIVYELVFVIAGTEVGFMVDTQDPGPVRTWSPGSDGVDYQHGANVSEVCKRLTQETRNSVGRAREKL